MCVDVRSGPAPESVDVHFQGNKKDICLNNIQSRNRLNSMWKDDFMQILKIILGQNLMMHRPVLEYNMLLHRVLIILFNLSFLRTIGKE